MRDNKDIVPEEHGRGRGAGLVFLVHLLEPGGEVGVDGGEGALDRVGDGVEVLGAQHRAAVQRRRAFLVQLVPEELDGGEAGVAVEDGGEGEAVEEGAGAEDDLVLHLVARALQLGGPPPDGLQLRRRRRHAAGRRRVAPRRRPGPAAAAADADAAPEPRSSGGGGGGGERQPRHTRAQQRHDIFCVYVCVFPLIHENHDRFG